MKIEEEAEKIFQGCREYWTKKASEHGAINWPPTQFENVELNKSVVEDLLRGFPGDLSKAVVMDFGCGEGRLIPYIAPKVARYIGVDASATACDYARKVAAIFDNAEIHEMCHAEDISGFDLKAVDLLVSWTVFQHIPHTLTNYFLKQISEGLRVGARAHIQFDWPPLHRIERREPKLKFDAMADDDCRCRWWPEHVIWDMLSFYGLEVFELPESESNQCWRAVKQ